MDHFESLEHILTDCSVYAEIAMWALLSASFLLAICGSSAKVVDTLYGPIDGNTVTLDDGSVIDSWLAVPFGRAPVGDLRFEV
jgi:acetylcholinesterase/neuroligin/receptor-type tyrosine-protein phosphatase gamma